MHAEAPETAVDERVAPQADDIVVRKTRVGALSTTDLHEQLRERGIDTLILAGIATGGVVLSTVRDAADRDYRAWRSRTPAPTPTPRCTSCSPARSFPARRT